MEAVLARYGSRITVTELNEALLHAVDEALAARTDDQLQQQLDRLRVIRCTMLESERGPQRMRANSSPVALASSSGKSGRDEGATLPADVLDPGVLAWLRAELVRCSPRLKP